LSDPQSGHRQVSDTEAKAVAGGIDCCGNPVLSSLRSSSSAALAGRLQVSLSDADKPKHRHWLNPVARDSAQRRDISKASAWPQLRHLCYSRRINAPQFDRAAAIAVKSSPQQVVMQDCPAGSGRDGRRRIAIAGIVGNVLEWYDFALYGYLATVFADQFFPSTDKFASLISAYAVFAVGFIARPLGAVIYGHIGDRLGRRRLLTVSVVMMGLPTFLLGLLPTYASVGVLAPVLLVALRFAQGISAGGEFSGSIIFLVEHAPPERRGLYGSLSNFGAMLGGLAAAAIASLVSAILPEAAVDAWGWRVPFLSGILITAAGLWLRLGVAESPEFLRMRAANALNANPVVSVLREHPKEVAVTAGLNWTISAGYYVVFVWLASDLSEKAGVGLENALLLSTVGLMLGTLLVPVVGLLSDTVGPRRMLAAAGFVTVVGAAPLLELTGSGSEAAATAGQLSLAAIMALYLGTVPAVFVSLHRASLRCSALSIGYNLATAIFSGTAPLIATSLVSMTRWQAAPGLYLAASALVGLALLGWVPSRLDRD